MQCAFSSRFRLFGKSLLTICLLTATIAGHSLTAADIALVNPDFEEVDSKTGFARGWRGNLSAAAQGAISIDDHLAASGKRSVKFDITQAGPNPATLTQTIKLAEPLATPVKGKISCRLYAHEVTKGVAFLVISTTNQDKARAQWVNTGNHRGTFDWKTVTHDMEFNPGTTAITFSFRMSGIGALWIDAAQLQLTVPETGQDTSTRLDFTGEVNPRTGLPGVWLEKKYHGNENVSAVSIETLDGRTAVRQQWSAGAAKSGLTVLLPEAYAKQKTVRLLVEAKTAGAGEAAIGLECLDTSGKNLGEILAPGVAKENWFTLDNTFVLPPTASQANILLLNTGAGTAWFASAVILPGTDDANALRLRERMIEAKVFPVCTSPEQLEGPPQFNTFADSPTKLTFHFKGKGSRLVKPALLIDLPANVRLADAFASHPSQWRAETFTSQPLTRPEGDYRRWRIENPRGMRLAKPDGFAYQRRVVLGLMPETPDAVKNGHLVFWHLENDGQADVEESFLLNILPPMPKTPNPKRFKFFRWNYEDLAFSRDDVLLASLRCIEEAGYNWCIRYGNNPRNQEICAMLAKRGWHFMLAGSLSDRYIPKDEKNVRVIDVTGKEIDRLCPEYMVNDPAFAGRRDALILEGIQRRNPQPGDVLIMDSEDWAPMDWCFCDRCRTNFARRIGLNQAPDAAVIKQQYAEQWRDFRVDNAMGKVKMVYDVARKHFPFLLIGDYNYVVDYTKPDYKNRFYAIAKDALLNEKYQDMHLPSYYHVLDATAFDMMRIGLDTLTKPYYPIVAVDGAGSYLTKDEVLTPPRFRMMCLNAAVTGCPGVAIYPGERLDGMFYLAADQVMAEIAAVEDYCLDGKLVPGPTVTAKPFRTVTTQAGGKEMTLNYPRWEQFFRHNTRELGKNRLISLLNHHAELTAYVEIGLDPAWAKAIIRDKITKTVYAVPANATTLLVAVPPRDARLLEVTYDADPAGFTPAPSQEDIKAAFQRDTEAFTGGPKQSNFKPQKDGSIELAFTDHDSDGILELAMITPNQKLIIDAEHGGGILDWQTGDIRLCPDYSRGQIIADNRLWTPKAARSDASAKLPCQVLESTLRDQTAIVTLRRTFDAVTLQLDKTFTVPAEGTSFRVDYKLTNTGQEPLHIAFWTRNILNPGNLANTLLDGDVRFPTEKGFQLADRKQDSTFVLSNAAKPEDIGNPRRGLADVRALPGPAYVDFTGSNLHVGLTPDPQGLAAYYLYNYQTVSTQEWIYLPVTIAPGQSQTYRENYQLGQGTSPALKQRP
ncbi:MAG: hypothetical protein GX937_08290 [Lentisphaerae bacterium]|nr:hypothetical protein [Lentisphaerota bacterium]